MRSLLLKGFFQTLSEWLRRGKLVDTGWDDPFNAEDRHLSIPTGYHAVFDSGLEAPGICFAGYFKLEVPVLHSAFNTGYEIPAVLFSGGSSFEIPRLFGSENL